MASSTLVQVAVTSLGSTVTSENVEEHLMLNAKKHDFLEKHMNMSHQNEKSHDSQSDTSAKSVNTSANSQDEHSSDELGHSTLNGENGTHIEEEELNSSQEGYKAHSVGKAHPESAPVTPVEFAGHHMFIDQGAGSPQNLSPQYTPLPTPSNSNPHGHPHFGYQYDDIPEALFPTQVQNVIQQHRKVQHRKFTKEEDNKIFEGVQKYGQDWNTIVKWGGLDRTGPQVRDRYRRITKKSPTVLIPNHTLLKEHPESPNQHDGPQHKKQKLTHSSSLGVMDFQNAASAAIGHTTTASNNSINHFTHQSGLHSLSHEQQFSSPATPNKIYNPVLIDRMIQTDPVLTEQKLNDDRIQLTQVIQQLETTLKEKELAAKKREDDLNNKFQKDVKDRESKLRKVIIDLYINQAKKEKLEAREQLAKKCVRLGQIVVQRHGAEFQEVWQDGKDFQELNNKLNVAMEERERLERQRRAYTNRAAKKKSNTSTTRLGDDNLSDTESNITNPYDINSQQEEICRLRINNLKKVETELQAEKEKLEIEKNLHIRELKRIRDEDRSRFNSFCILKDRYLLLMLVGKGGFSEVHKAFDLVELRDVACKIHQLNSQWNEERKANFTKHVCREQSIHKQLDHPRVVRLYDVFEIDNNTFCTILEYCGMGCDLDLQLKNHKMFTEREARSVIVQIFSGLKYLNEQSKPIIHYDLKPGNILYINGEVKITDFGLSKIMEDHDAGEMELTSQGAGTYWYLPPETFEVGKRPPKISSKVDVWSAGVIFYQLLYGKKPFGHDLSQQKILADQTILNAKNVDFPDKPIVSQPAKDFIRRCLAHNVIERPDVQQICKDPFLQGSYKTKNSPRNTTSGHESG